MDQENFTLSEHTECNGSRGKLNILLNVLMWKDQRDKERQRQREGDWVKDQQSHREEFVQSAINHASWMS